jgi:hypothetical protein
VTLSGGELWLDIFYFVIDEAMAVQNAKADVDALKEQLPGSTHPTCIQTYSQTLSQMGVQY